jgi:hypothetical protein
MNGRLSQFFDFVNQGDLGLSLSSTLIQIHAHGSGLLVLLILFMAAVALRR